MLDLNLPGAAVAALATFVIGGPWYSNALFGERWRRAMAVSDAKPGHPAKVFGFAYLFSPIAAGCLSTLITPGTGALAGLIHHEETDDGRSRSGARDAAAQHRGENRAQAP